MASRFLDLQLLPWRYENYPSLGLTGKVKTNGGGIIKFSIKKAQFSGIKGKFTFRMKRGGEREQTKDNTKKGSDQDL